MTNTIVPVVLDDCLPPNEQVRTSRMCAPARAMSPHLVRSGLLLLFALVPHTSHAWAHHIITPRGTPIEIEIPRCFVSPRDKEDTLVQLQRMRTETGDSWLA